MTAALYRGTAGLLHAYLRNRRAGTSGQTNRRGTTPRTTESRVGPTLSEQTVGGQQSPVLGAEFVASIGTLRLGA